MQGVGEPDEEQEAGYPQQQHLQLCPPSAPPSELAGLGWLGYHPGVARGSRWATCTLISPLQSATECLCHASSKDLLENSNNQSRNLCVRMGGP